MRKTAQRLPQQRLEPKQELFRWLRSLGPHFFWLLAVRLPRFVMRQDVFLRLAVHNVDVVISQVDWLYPVTGGINHHRDASTCHAARDQHRHQACG